MSRPRDEFSWAQVEVTEDGWRCKFCKEEFEGSASRFWNHLSAQGTDISACPAVPKEIRSEALNKGTRERGQTLPISSSSTPTSLLQDPSPSSLNDRDSFIKMCMEEYVAHAFIKLLMCNGSSSAISDVLKYPYIREFLERADVGAPSSMIQGDPKFVIEKSLLNIKQEVYQYMLMVKESWKTTDCTLVMFNLNPNNKGKSSIVYEKDRYVCGFYCPQGFIFVETPDPSIDQEGFLDALERHSPSLSLDNANLEIVHVKSAVGNDLLCEFGDVLGADVCMGRWCFRSQIPMVCIRVCSSSEWAQGLINKAIKIQKLIQSDVDLACWCDRLLAEKGKRLKHKGYINAKGASGLSNFLSIMLLEDELKEKLSYKMRFRLTACNQDDVEAILDDFDFWDDGRKLEQVLNLILKISDLMDTLIPTAGYLAMAVNTVEDTISKCRYANMDDVNLLWEKVVSQLTLSISGGLWDWGVLGYLNPLYYLQQIQKDPELLFKVVNEVRYSQYMYQEDTEKLKGELAFYHDVCNNLPREINLHNYHPVKFWEKYGGELPTLQKLAIKVLSRPVTCMCNQVKKHLYELQGADDVVLKLNLRMMEEFKLLGDDIYKPIDLSELTHWWSS